MEKIQHFTTGWTIDSLWEASKDTAVPWTDSFINEYVNNISRYIWNFKSEILFLKDSRETLLSDQDLLVAKILESPIQNILVTSWTFLMPDFARLTAGNPLMEFNKDKNIIFTWSIKPMVWFLRSDWWFNLWMSIAGLQSQINWVFICMNWWIFDWVKVRKDLSSASFSSSESWESILWYSDFDLITIWWTIDFIWDWLDSLVADSRSKIPDYFRDDVKFSTSTFTSLNPFLKDSRNLSDKDKQKVLDITKSKNTSKNILITTWIYKLEEIQNYLKDNLPKNNKKRIILTGSRIPLNFWDETDAPFNLWYSLWKFWFLEPWVYISLSWKILWENENPLSFLYTEEEQEYLKNKMNL